MASDDQLRRWSYTARDGQGNLISGAITADSETTAAKRLQTMGLAPLAINARGVLNENLLNTKIERRKPVKAKHIALLARQLTTMIEAGLPLVRSLGALADQSDHPEFRTVLPKVRAEVQSGTALSLAMSKHENAFPPLMVGMVAAGEVAGDLAASLQQVADNYEKEAKLRSKVVSAMTYPVIVLILAFLLVTGMLIFVVPRFAEVFTTLGGELPFLTQMLITISGLMVYILPGMAVGVVGFLFWWGKNKNERYVRDVVDPAKLKMPVFGSFFQKIAIARFSRTLSSLVNSGVPILQALEIVANTSGNIVISDAMMAVRESVREGRPINMTLGEHKVFPPLVIQMVATGEETGALPTMLLKIAEYYEREVETASDSLGALIEPLLLMFLGATVGGMVLALYMPIFSIFEVIQQNT